MKTKTTKAKQKSAYEKFCDKCADFYNTHAKNVDWAVIGLIFVICLGARIYDISIKKQLHPDEVYSLMISTCNQYYNQNIPDGDYTGNELKQLITGDDIGGVSGALSDVAQLWKNNGDAPHASLYYMTLRFFLIGMDNYDLTDFVWRGSILNLIFFAISFLLMVRLLRSIYGKRSLLVFVGLAVAFGCAMSVRNTLLIREYQMAETAIIAMILVGVNLVLTLRRKEEINVKKYFIGFALSIAAAISLGYFNAIFVIFFGIGIMICCFRHKQPRLAWIMASSAIAAVMIAIILYPGFFNFILHESVHRERAFSNSNNILKYVFARDLVMSFLTLQGLIGLGAAFIVALVGKNRISLFKTQNFAWIPVIAIACMIIIQYASLLKMSRYYFALVPALALLVPHIISCVPKSLNGFFELLVVFYFPTLLIFVPAKTIYKDWSDLKKGLGQPTVFYHLNPNEVARMIPCTVDTISYTISNDIEQLGLNRGETYIATKQQIGIANDSITTYKRPLLKHIKLYKFEYRPTNEDAIEAKYYLTLPDSGNKSVRLFKKNRHIQH